MMYTWTVNIEVRAKKFSIKKTSRFRAEKRFSYDFVPVAGMLFIVNSLPVRVQNVFLDLGCPHCVLFTDTIELDIDEVEAFGRKLESEEWKVV